MAERVLSLARSPPHLHEAVHTIRHRIHRALIRTLFWSVDAVESNTFRAWVVQDFDGVTVEDGDDLTLILWL
jgi:xylose isomerase